MAGSLEKSEHKYFESVANALSTNPDTNNVVYLLVHEIEDRAVFQVTKKSDRLFTIQVPRLAKNFEANYKVARMNRLERFVYNQKLTEEENFVNLDGKHLECYFTENPDTNQTDFLLFLKEQKFDVAIGSTYQADSFMFKYLGINYLKLTPEDVESYTMQFKFNMPVQLSAYPSSKAVVNFDYGDMPSYDSQSYRQQMNKGYMLNRYNRFRYMQRVKQALPLRFHESLLNEHASE